MTAVFEGFAYEDNCLPPTLSELVVWSFPKVPESHQGVIWDLRKSSQGPGRGVKGLEHMLCMWEAESNFTVPPMTPNTDQQESPSTA